jgi:hypothetical protein
MTKVLQALITDGVEIDEAALAWLSPYQTEHINGFGPDTRSNGIACRNHWTASGSSACRRGRKDCHRKD